MEVFRILSLVHRLRIFPTHFKPKNLQKHGSYESTLTTYANSIGCELHPYKAPGNTLLLD